MQQRHHGTEPPDIVIVHGGPGCAGEVAPVAQDLARRGRGVLEPFQTEHSVAGQIAGLAQAIDTHGAPPVVVVGWSWGAWLALYLAAEHPDLVRRLVLVGCPPLEADHAAAIRSTRLSRLSDAGRVAYAALPDDLSDPADMTRAMQLFEATDCYARNDDPAPPVVFDAAIHRTVWAEAAALRQSGALLRSIAAVRCPVAALHGDHDPHPAQGVAQPLRRALPAATFTLLEQCGHTPWHERHARAAFFDALDQAIG